MNITNLKKGQGGIIKELKESPAKMKLMEMGCVPGNKVILRHIAPLGNPLAIEVLGYKLSLRKEEAHTIIIEAI